MLLYHFTSHPSVPGIMLEGLMRGEAPLADDRWVKAINLTTDRDPSGHGLDHGGHIWTQEDSLKIFMSTGQWIEPGTININKRAIRLTVRLSSTDQKLKDWLPWARKRLAPEYLERLVAAAGGSMKKAKTWKLYFGIVPPSAIVGIDILEPSACQPGSKRAPTAAS